MGVDIDRERRDEEAREGQVQPLQRRRPRRSPARPVRVRAQLRLRRVGGEVLLAGAGGIGRGRGAGEPGRARALRGLRNPARRQEAVLSGGGSGGRRLRALSSAPDPARWKRGPCASDPEARAVCFRSGPVEARAVCFRSCQATGSGPFPRWKRGRPPRTNQGTGPSLPPRRRARVSRHARRAVRRRIHSWTAMCCD